MQRYLQCPGVIPVSSTVWFCAVFHVEHLVCWRECVPNWSHTISPGMQNASLMASSHQRHFFKDKVWRTLSWFQQSTNLHSAECHPSGREYINLEYMVLTGALFKYGNKQLFIWLEVYWGFFVVVEGFFPSLNWLYCISLTIARYVDAISCP